MGLGKQKSFDESIHRLTHTRSALVLTERVPLHSVVEKEQVAIETTKQSSIPDRGNS